jgi:hypothetical protein
VIGFRLVVIAAIAGCLMMATASRAVAQVAVEVGVAPECPQRLTTTALLMAALPTGTTAQSGLTAVYVLALARGFMALTTSGVM